MRATVLAFGLAALLAMAITLAQAADRVPRGRGDARPYLNRAAVFSDDPLNLHDPRHPQPQTGADKMFAPIGIVQTNRRQPNQGSESKSAFHMGTGFLVSPCYLMTNFHVVFGYRKNKPEGDQDYSATFSTMGKKSRAVPVRYGEFYRFRGRDWVLLKLDSDPAHPCLGEDPDIGWTRLMPLSTTEAANRSLSIAGYPSDRSLGSLWRQDSCRMYEKSGSIENDGIWTTDCPTRPRSSGSPIFYLHDRVLNVVAIMHGHTGPSSEGEILPRWDPKRANLALDIGKIVLSDSDLRTLIENDIRRFSQPNPAQLLQPEAPRRQSRPPRRKAS